MTGCPHGMPSRGSCVECMAEGPVGPLKSDTPSKAGTAKRTMMARFDGYCAWNPGHHIQNGDSIGYVEDVGWCCSECYADRE